MSTFLLVYDRREKRLRELQLFKRRTDALTARVQAEIEALGSEQDWEVVVLEATSKDVLRRTHASYFSGSAELAAEAAREPVGTA
jgi:hypothetical protein